MPYDFGDVVLVPFPFTSQTKSKRRPAVVVNRRSYSEHRPDVIIMAITSQLHASDGELEMRVTGWRAASLLKPSVVKPVLATIEQQLVVRTLGRLNAFDQSSLRRTIRAILDMESQ